MLQISTMLSLRDNFKVNLLLNIVCYLSNKTCLVPHFSKSSIGNNFNGHLKHASRAWLFHGYITCGNYESYLRAHRFSKVLIFRVQKVANSKNSACPGPNLYSF